MIKAIRAKNFRSIKQMPLLEIPKFSLLLGKNAAGKTTLINIIELTQRLAGGTETELALSSIVASYGELFNLKSEERKIDIELFAENKDGITFRYLFCLIPRSTPSERKLVVETELLEKIVGGKETKIFSRNHDDVYSYLNDEKKQLPLKVYDNKLALSSYADDEAAGLVNLLSSAVFISSNETGRPSSHSVIQENTPDLKTLDGVMVALKLKSPELFDKANESIKRVIPNYNVPNIVDIADIARNKNKEGNSKNKSFLVFWDSKNALISSMSLSSGDIRTCFLLYTLFNTNAGSLLAIEEIENGIHWGRISRIMDELRTQARNLDVQIILTSHSQGILEGLLPNEAIYCKKADRGAEYKIVGQTEGYSAIKEDLIDKEPSLVDMLEAGLLD